MLPALEVFQIALKALGLALGETPLADQAAELALRAAEAEHDNADVWAIHEGTRST